MHQIEKTDLLRVEGLKKVFRSGTADLVLFENLSFRVSQGEMLAIVGQSGAGKSTLLHILGALDTPSRGDVYCASIQLSSLSARQAATFRNREVGYVWQFHYLLPLMPPLMILAGWLLDWASDPRVKLPAVAGALVERRGLAQLLRDPGIGRVPRHAHMHNPA